MLEALLTQCIPSQLVVRGCIAMYSPPRSITLPDGTLLPEEQWRPVFGEDLEETLPAQTSERMPPGWNFIHYDLDPQNGNTEPLSLCPMTPAWGPDEMLTVAEYS